jgi:hypothetical protein
MTSDERAEEMRGLRQQTHQNCVAPKGRVGDPVKRLGTGLHQDRTDAPCASGRAEA